MNNNETALAEVAPLVSFLHKGKSYSFRIEAGFPLTPDRLGNIPRKVLKKAEKLWRTQNPPKHGFAMPALVGPYALVLLKDWFAEKLGALRDGAK